MNDHTGATPPLEHDPEASRPRNRLRTGPIVRGALFLAFCAWVTQRTFFPTPSPPSSGSRESPSAWVHCYSLSVLY